MLGSGRSDGARNQVLTGGRRRRRLAATVVAAAIGVVLSLTAPVETAQAAPASASAPTAPTNGWPTSPPSAGAKPAVNANGDQGVSVSRNRDGRLEAFRGCGPPSGIHLLHTYQVAPNSGWAAWSDWGPLAGLTDPHVVMNADGRLEVFLSNALGIVHAWQLWPGGPWSALAQLTTAGPVNSVAAAKQADGRIELFFQCACVNGIVGHIWQQYPGGEWFDPEPLNTAAIPVGTGTAFLDENGDLEYLSYASGSPLVYLAKWATSTGGGWYFTTVAAPTVTLFGNPDNQMAVAINADGRAEVFLSTTTGVWNMWQTAPGGTWSGFSHLTSASNYNVSVARNPDGRLELFFVPAGGVTNPLHQWQVAPGFSWSEPAPLTNNSGRALGAAVATVNNADSRLESFFLGVDSSTGEVSMLHAWQENRNLGPWSDLITL